MSRQETVDLVTFTEEILHVKLHFLRSGSCYAIPCRPNPGRIEKINLKFYFHTFLWFLKRFYEGL